MSVSYSYFLKFDNIFDKYMEMFGEGDTKASQIVTAVNTLIYQWYNDGCVFDTQQQYSWTMDCANDVSNHANWLDQFTNLSDILSDFYDCTTKNCYEELLKKLADTALNEEYLAPYAKQCKEGSIYDCKGEFKYVIHHDDEYEDED